MQILAVAFLFAVFVAAVAQQSIFEFSVQDSEGEEIALSTYSDKKVIIIVNVASNCGYTYSNYRGLVDLYDKYKDKGLEILAFPSNQFGEQEPGTDAQIQEFCGNAGVNFPVFKKVNVNGPDAIPLFKYLKQKAGRSEIQWNFNKFVVVDGKPIYRYGASVKPSDMETDVQHHLGLMANQGGDGAGAGAGEEI
jgi:glutathione peroxidase